ncbi:hypothetical protein WA026_014363 [Henosepilachna vigintioctopunctata]|uniref:Uncharacterized protein n=1 Tax=Henosepilachna vigintioctopunctata TaxID=420089 RepID=A0AAW1UET4_9CUCU
MRKRPVCMKERDSVEKKTFESIEDFILSEIPSNIEIITEDKWKKKQGETRHWLLFFCTGNTDCLESKTQIKLAAALGEIMNIGVIMDDELARNIYKDYNVNPIIYWQKIGNDADKDIKKQPVSGSDFLEMMDNILNLLPSPNLLMKIILRKYDKIYKGRL